MNRNDSIDHIRILLTGLVIFHHTSITYGGPGAWYWKEIPGGSNLILTIFNIINQSFFMGFFFLLAGYFTAASYERKPIGVFLKIRCLRLGVPLIFYFFILSPMTTALVSTESGSSFWSGWWKATMHGEFGPGPLWFVESLLLLTVVYIIYRKFAPKFFSREHALPSLVPLGLVTILLGFISFTVRLAIPLDKEIIGLILGYFPCYIFLFFAGCLAFRQKVLERITFRDTLPWLLVAFVTISSLPVLMNYSGPATGPFEGGLNMNALIYALWDPFTAWGIILGLLWLSHTYWHTANQFTRFLARRAYTIYIIHPPALVGISLLMSEYKCDPLFKFLITGSLTCLACTMISSLILMLPYTRKVL